MSVKKELPFGRIILVLVAVLGVVLILFGGSIKENADEKGDKKMSEFREETVSELTALISDLKGVYDVSLLITVGESGNGYRVEGVSVVCKGGEDPYVQKNITDLVSALYGLTSSRISVAGR